MRLPKINVHTLQNKMDIILKDTRQKIRDELMTNGKPSKLRDRVTSIYNSSLDRNEKFLEISKIFNIHYIDKQEVPPRHFSRVLPYMDLEFTIISKEFNNTKIYLENEFDKINEKDKIFTQMGLVFIGEGNSTEKTKALKKIFTAHFKLQNKEMPRLYDQVIPKLTDCLSIKFSQFIHHFEAQILTDPDFKRALAFASESKELNRIYYLNCYDNSEEKTVIKYFKQNGNIISFQQAKKLVEFNENTINIVHDELELKGTF